jgi:hypothetical protein
MHKTILTMKSVFYFFVHMLKYFFFLKYLVSYAS